jgi:hypothetical protein
MSDFAYKFDTATGSVTIEPAGGSSPIGEFHLPCRTPRDVVPFFPPPVTLFHHYCRPTDERPCDGGETCGCFPRWRGAPTVGDACIIDLGAGGGSDE